MSLASLPPLTRTPPTPARIIDDPLVETTWLLLQRIPYHGPLKKALKSLHHYTPAYVRTELESRTDLSSTPVAETAASEVDWASLVPASFPGKLYAALCIEDMCMNGPPSAEGSGMSAEQWMEQFAVMGGVTWLVDSFLAMDHTTTWRPIARAFGSVALHILHMYLGVSSSCSFPRCFHSLPFLTPLAQSRAKN